MEDWQQKIITNNKEKLIDLIDPNITVMAALESKGLIDKQQAQTLKTTGRIFGSRVQTDQLLDIIVTKAKTKENDPSKEVPAFDYFVELLETQTQTGASLLLQKESKAYLRAGTTTSKNDLKESSSSKVADIQMDTIDGSQYELLKKEYLEEAEKDRPLVINVELPKQDMASYLEKNSHLISPDEENLALIINIKQFSTYEDANGSILNPSRDGSEHDEAYLRALLPKLGFTIFRENEIDWETGNWTKEDVLDFINAFQKHCTRRHPKAILVFIGSHGKLGSVYTSDSHELPEESQTINLWEDVFSKFYDKNCTALKGKPKIFLVNACQVFNVQSDNIYIKGAAVTDMLCCTAQVPGKEAYREPNSGSWFVHCIAFYLMKCAKEMDLMSIFNLANGALGCREGVIASIKNKVESGQIATAWPLNLNKKIYILLKPNQ